MTHTLRLASWNCWGGCVPGPKHNPNHIVDFIEDMAHQHDVLHLQEVHYQHQTMGHRFVYPRIQKGEPGPCDTALGNLIMSRLERSHHTYFTPHFKDTALHDREATHLPVSFGNLCVVTKKANLLKHSRGYGYGAGHLNTENDHTGRGQPASRAADVLTLGLGHRRITVHAVHGIWSKHGKRDIPARRAQNSGWKQLVRRHWRTMKQSHAAALPLVSIGDFNYTSDNEVLQDFTNLHELFGEPGINLNHHHNISDTRTHHYEKSVREADFAIVAPSLFSAIDGYVVHREVPSDHAVLSLSLIG